MSKWLKYLLVALALLVSMAIALPMLVPVDTIRQEAEKAVSEASGMQVRIGGMSLSLFPLPGLSVAEIVVEDVPGATPRAVVASGTLTVALAPLFDERVELQSIRFNAIDLRVSEQASGSEVHVVHIDSVTGAVQLSQGELKLLQWQGDLYGGKINLDAVISPLSGDRNVTAQISCDGLQLRPLLSDASGRDNLSGTLSTLLDVSTHGRNDKAFQRNLKADGPVHLNNGTLAGMGLEGPAVALVHGKLGGETIEYESLKFKLIVRGMARWLNGIALTSSHLNATGQIHIAGSGKMDGEIATSGIAGLTGAKLIVAGSTEQPRIFPAPSSLLGGAIGGTIAGPAGAAVGSKVGSSAGNMVEGVGNTVKGLFGK